MPVKKLAGFVCLLTAFELSGRLPVGLAIERAYEAGQFYSRQRVGLDRKTGVVKLAQLTIRSKRLATAAICKHTLPAKALVNGSYLAGPQAP